MFRETQRDFGIASGQRAPGAVFQRNERCVFLAGVHVQIVANFCLMAFVATEAARHGRIRIIPDLGHAKRGKAGIPGDCLHQLGAGGGVATGLLDEDESHAGAVLFVRQD